MVTILTPSYNRSHLLPRLYESLKNQTCYNFEWLVVDDGSTDSTEKLVTDWRSSEKHFPIRYIKRDNGGKHRALNTGIPQAQFDFICIIDSDDYMTLDGIEWINKWIDNIKNCENFEAFAGVSGLKVYQSGQIIGRYPQKLNGEFIDANNFERFKYHLTGDKAEVYRKDILLKYPFPEFEGEKFLSECAVWDRIAIAGYKLRWFNQPICICEYLTDGLSKAKNKEFDNFQGFTYITKQALDSHFLFYELLSSSSFLSVARMKRLSNNEICHLLNINFSFLWLTYVALLGKKIIKFFIA